VHPECNIYIIKDLYQLNPFVLILTQALFAKESKKAKTILQRKEKKIKKSKKICNLRMSKRAFSKYA